MIVVLADDFSGAAEIAGAALQHGLTAEVRVDHARLADGHEGSSAPGDCDVVVVDTNTRSLPPESAARTIGYLAGELREMKLDWSYKKIDSVLRGSVLVEIDALRNALGFPHCLLVNANPRKDRIVVQGELWVGGRRLHETQFADDPEHPSDTSSVLELLRRGDPHARVQVVDSPLDVEKSISLASHESPSAPVLAPVCCAGNCRSASELREFARQVTTDTLAVGAAEFFEALLEMRGYARRAAQSVLIGPQGTLIVSGTATQEQAFPNASTAAIVHVVLTSESRQSTASAVCKQLKECGRAILSSRRVELGPADHRSADHRSAGRRSADHSNTDEQNTDEQNTDEQNTLADRLHAEMVAAVLLVAQQCRPQQLWIEGGRTASSIVRALGWKRLIAEECYADGVVGLRSVDASAPMVVVKPGSYRWPDPL